MIKTGKRITGIVSTIVILAAGLSACSTAKQPAAADTTIAAEQTASAQVQTAEDTTEDNGTETLSGAIIMVGSTSMEKLANAACEAFMNKYENVTATAEFNGSGAGIEALLAGSADIGNVSRALKGSEKESGVVENIVAIDGIAVIVDSENTVKNLTREELSNIFMGSVTNWSELGGENQPIVVVGREAGSGTRGAFEEILGVEDVCAYSNELDNTGAVVAKVAATKGAIGYVSLDVIGDTVKAVELEGVAATPENIASGSYFLSRPFIMATKGTIEEQNEVVQAWFSFLKTEEGKTLIEGVGLIAAE